MRRGDPAIAGTSRLTRRSAGIHDLSIDRANVSGHLRHARLGTGVNFVRNHAQTGSSFTGGHTKRYSSNLEDPGRNTRPGSSKSSRFGLIPVRHLVQEPSAGNESAVGRSRLNENGVLLEAHRAELHVFTILALLVGLRRELEHLADLGTIENVAGRLVHQHDFLVAMDGLGLRQLVEPAALLEVDALGTYKLCDSLLLVDGQDLEPSSRHGVE